MFSGVVTIIAQIVIASVPGIIHGAWEIFMMTCIGTVLALLESSLPEWRIEKWCTRKQDKDKTVCLTPGNGSNRVIVISSRAGDLDLEALAGGRFDSGWYTKGATIIFAICWILFLLAVAGIKENAWILLLVGTLGMVQNIVAAGLHRNPSALGIHLEPDRGNDEQQSPFVYPKPPKSGERPEGIMSILKRLEVRYPRAGACLLDEFFHKGMRKEEEIWWEEMRIKYESEKVKAREKQRQLEEEKKRRAQTCDRKAGTEVATVISEQRQQN
jgi:hypothetical protein